MLELGIFRRAHGVRGEIKLTTSLPEKYFPEVSRVYINGETYVVEKMRPVTGGAILKLKGVDDKNAADSIRGMAYIPDEYRPTLDDDEYFLDDLIGKEVFSGSEKIGNIIRAERITGRDIWTISTVKGEVMVPVIDGLVAEFALDKGFVVLDETIFGRVGVYEN